MDARAVCDASGAQGGFIPRRGRTADATAALVPDFSMQCRPSQWMRGPSAMHRELGADSFLGGKGQAMRRPRLRPTPPTPCSARLCVCLHHRVWQRTYSLQPATACDRSVARGQSSHWRAGEVTAAAAYPDRREFEVHSPVSGKGRPLRRQCAPSLCSPMLLPQGTKKKGEYKTSQ